MNCRWCSRPVEARSSFGDDYYRHVGTLGAGCFFDGVWREVEPGDD